MYLVLLSDRPTAGTQVRGHVECATADDCCAWRMSRVSLASATLAETFARTYHLAHDQQLAEVPAVNLPHERQQLQYRLWRRLIPGWDRRRSLRPLAASTRLAAWIMR